MGWVTDFCAKGMRYSVLACLLVSLLLVEADYACDATHTQGYSPDVAGRPGYQDGEGAESGWLNGAFDPINPESGEFTHQETDLFILTRGLPLTFTRTYRSRSTTNLALGPGWDFLWHQRIMSLDDETVILHGGQSRLLRFVPDYTAFEDDLESGTDLWETIDPPWALTDQTFHSPSHAWKNDGTVDGAVLVSTPFNLLSATQPRLRFYSFFPYNFDNGTGTVEASTDGINWTQVGELSSAKAQQTWGPLEMDLSDFSGQPQVKIRFVMNVHTNPAYPLDPVWWIDDVRVDMDLPASGDIQYKAPNGVYDYLMQNTDGSFTLTSKHGIKREFDADGKLVEVRDRNGNTLTFRYYQESGEDKLYPVTGHSDYFVDQAFGLVALDYRLKEVEDATGRIVTLTYYDTGRLEKVVDFKGREWTYGYDPDTGDLVSVTNPVGKIKWYDYVNHQMVSLTDYKNQTYLTNQYSEVVQGAKHFIQSQDFGSGTSVVDEYVIEANGLVSQVKVTNQRGVGGEFNFDALGRMTAEVIESDGYPSGETDFVTNYEYNEDGEVIRIVFPRGNAVEYYYDDMGNVYEIRQKAIGMTPWVADPSDIVTKYTFEPVFNFVWSMEDPRGNTTIYTYDYELPPSHPDYGEAGNLHKITYPQVEGVNPEVVFTYNDYGQVETETDPNGNVVKYFYDSTPGYLTRIIRGFGSSNEITIDVVPDEVGNFTDITDPNGNTTLYDHDDLDRIYKITSPVPFQYETHLTHDEIGNLIQVDRQVADSPSGPPPPTGTVDPDDDWQSVVYVYNDLDRIERIINDSNDPAECGYDLTGNLGSFKDPELNSTNYEYEERNLLWKVTDAKVKTTEYQYDANGNLNFVKDVEGNETSYDYDDFDRLIRKTYDDGSFETIDEYDKASNVRFFTNVRGQQIELIYDDLNRLEDKKYAGTSTVFHYDYDPGSRLETLSDPTGKITYIHNELDRITDVTTTPSGGQPATTISYEYDDTGNRTKLTYPDGDFITYEYDELNRLEFIRDSLGQAIAEYKDYDALGRYETLVFENSAENAYIYDNLNRWESLTVKDASQATILNIDYTHYDKAGNLKLVTDAYGDHQFDYDEIYQLEDADHPSGYGFPDTLYTYDFVGNRLEVTEGGGPPVTYVPNNLNQYDSVGGVTYSYDSDGNLTYDGQTTYTYDREGQLTDIQASGLTIHYEYDGLGRRVQQEVNGTITRFLYDGDEVLVETDGSGAILAKYVYGPGLDQPIRMERGGQMVYYHADRLGSILVLTDGSGYLLETYCYDAYGKPAIFDDSGTPLSQSQVGNRYFFTGREYDLDSKFYYYRTRYYSPVIGRFLSRDLWPGWIYEPLVFVNSYLYVLNNPINWSDSYGLSPEDVDKIFKTFKKTINNMTAEGLRTPDYRWNNRFRTMYILSCGLFGSPYKGCGQQTDYVIGEFNKIIDWDDNWLFEIQKDCSPHQWGIATSDNPDDPIIMFDAWKNIIYWKRKQDK